MNITGHFSRREFTRSRIAGKFGIENQPDDRQWWFLHRFCVSILEPARSVVGPIVITSGFRSRVLNLHPGIAGHKNSDHMILGDSCAADIVADDLGALFRYIYIELPWSRLIWEMDSWIHVSWRDPDPPKKRKPCKAIDDGSGKTLYRPLKFNEICILGR